jgi:hypothetical protein
MPNTCCFLNCIFAYGLSQVVSGKDALVLRGLDVLQQPVTGSVFVSH